MKILYISQACSTNIFNKYLADGSIDSIPNAQKYHRLMLEGLAKNVDELISISGYPVRIGYKHLFYRNNIEISNNVKYKNVSFINLMFIRQICLYLNVICEIRKHFKENNDIIVVCDIWYLAMASAAKKICKKLKIPVIGIVTDVPNHTLKSRRKNLSFIKRLFGDYLEKKTNKAMYDYDGYLLLTEPMNEVVNKNNKPYIVLEGHSDSLQRINNSIEKRKPKVMMYSGSIHKEYGIGALVEAFISGNYENWEFDIYGKGNYESELVELCKKYQNIKYYGYRENEYIVKEQQAATLLVNPRFTSNEYVKYSFPSKTFEYMASGTPLLMTKLPWMPKEYLEYIYLFEEESVDGFKKTLDYILTLSSDELNKMGNKAKEFILNNKNNVQQSKKFVDFLKFVKKNY